MKYILASSTLIIALFISSCSGSGGESKKGELYQCPMKCEGEKTYDKSGSCPLCKMDLEKIENTYITVSENSERKTRPVQIIGEMRNVMHKGELFGSISLDTIANKTNLYGLGPVEYLSGEVLIMNGHAYKSTVVSATEIKIEETFNVKAPFFVYTNVTDWDNVDLPDSIQSIPQLETYLDNTTKNKQRPFAFKLSANVETGDIHIVNLPKGTKVSSPEDAHKNQSTYKLSNEQVDMIGFFSIEHQGIFTHHDSFVHIHLITTDKTKMGHLDKVLWKKGTVKLYLPKQ